LDPLRDEAIDYAMRLWYAAVGCELHVLSGVIHGFDAIVPESPLAHTALDLVIASLRRLAALES
jgi:acetyl esterase